MANAMVGMLLAAIDEAYDKKSWHGPNLRGSVRGLTLPELVFRPGPGRHNIWEHAIHAAYWKYVVRRRILGEKKGSFPLKGSNWFERPCDGAEDESAWRAEVALLEETHRALRSAAAGFTDADLAVTPAGSKVSNAAILRGIAAHDVYHAGQIQLLKRLARLGASGR